MSATGKLCTLFKLFLFMYFEHLFPFNFICWALALLFAEKVKTLSHPFPISSPSGLPALGQVLSEQHVPWAAAPLASQQLFRVYSTIHSLNSARQSPWPGEPGGGGTASSMPHWSPILSQRDKECRAQRLNETGLWPGTPPSSDQPLSGVGGQPQGAPCDSISCSPTGEGQRC